MIIIWTNGNSLSMMSPRPWERRRSFSRATSSLSSRTNLLLGSSLMTALQRICLALSAYLRRTHDNGIQETTADKSSVQLFSVSLTSFTGSLFKWVNNLSSLGFFLTSGRKTRKEENHLLKGLKVCHSTEDTNVSSQFYCRVAWWGVYTLSSHFLTTLTIKVCVFFFRTQIRNSAIHGETLFIYLE